MPRMIQLHVSSAEERPNGGMPLPKADILEPEDFQAMVKQVFSMENVEVCAHNVGRNQVEFIRAYAERVIPKLDWPEKG
jgi:coenzyme F420-dependent glucose-6-phosphate dehydrogenase